MKKKFLKFLDDFWSKKDSSLQKRYFSFLDFTDEKKIKDIFYLEEIRATHFLEYENSIVIENYKGKDNYDELQAIWLFWIEKFIWLSELLFFWNVPDTSLFDCLNINSKIKENNFIEISLQLRDKVTKKSILLKRVFQNIMYDSYDEHFYYFENQQLITTDDKSEKVQAKLRTLKNYMRVALLSQILYVSVNDKKNYENKLLLLEKITKQSDTSQYKIQQKDYQEKYDEAVENEWILKEILFEYDVLKLYEVIDFVHKNPWIFLKDKKQEDAEIILHFLHNIGFTHIPQTQANRLFSFVDWDIDRFHLHFPISDLFTYFDFFWKEWKNKPFEYFINFFNTLLTWDKNFPIERDDIHLYKIEGIQTSYNTKEFWDYVKTTLLDKNGNINLEFLKYRFQIKN